MDVVSLYRYPVKGLSPEQLDELTLTRGDYVPGDRLYAIENGPSGFDTSAPSHQAKIKFLMLMRNEALARLRTRYHDESRTLAIVTPDGREIRADLSTEGGRAEVEAFCRRELASELRGPPRVIEAPDGFRFTDSRRGCVSIINLASVAAVADLLGRPVDPLRFRGNVMVSGLAPFAEFDLVGQTLAAPSGLALRITKRIVRCAATNVDPTTGARDLDIPRALMKHLGHADLGVYAEVKASGSLRPGDEIARSESPQASLDLRDAG